MPELPEVELTRRGLLQALPSSSVKLKELIFYRQDLRYPLPILAQKELLGKKLLQISRRGKYLIFEFESQKYLISHLGMSGSWQTLAQPADQKIWVPLNHDHVRMELNHVWLIYNDPRRFGFLEYLENFEQLEVYFAKMGLEPLAADWQTEELWRRLKPKKQAIKVALMDQSILAGVGNIYACEVLFRLGLDPRCPADKLELGQVQKMRILLAELLESSIHFGGSSIQDFKHTTGQAGAFQKRFSVYGRAGEKCPVCGEKIKEVKLVGRSTFWCPRCQPRKIKKKVVG